MPIPRTCNYIISVDATTTPITYNIDTSTGISAPSFNKYDAFSTIQSALDQNPIFAGGPGDIHIKGGNYALGPSFTGFSVQSNTRLFLDNNASIIVPNGYGDISNQNYVFKLSDKNHINVSYCIMDGGIILEKGPLPQRKWTGIVLESNSYSKGVLSNKFMNMTIQDAGIGIQLVAVNPVKICHNPPILLNDIDGGWVNGNSFHSLRMLKNTIFFDFVMDGCYVRDTEHTGIFGNHFENISCNADSNTIYGFRNIGT